MKHFDWLTPQQASDIVSRLKENLGDGWDDIDADRKCETEVLVCCAKKYSPTPEKTATYVVKGVLDLVTSNDAWLIKCQEGDLTSHDKLELALCAYVCVCNEVSETVKTRPPEFRKSGHAEFFERACRDTTSLQEGRREFKLLNIPSNEGLKLDISSPAKEQALKEVGDFLVNNRLKNPLGPNPNLPALPPDGFADKARKEIYRVIDEASGKRAGNEGQYHMPAKAVSLGRDDRETADDNAKRMKK